MSVTYCRTRQPLCGLQFLLGLLLLLSPGLIALAPGLAATALAQPPAAANPAGADAPTAPPETESDIRERNKLPLLTDLPWPEVATLLADEPRDWVLLFGGRVLEIPAVFPRPDHLDWLVAQQKALSPTRPTDPAELPAWLEKYRRFNSILIEIDEEGIEEDYLLHTRYIDKILYHEDLALNKANELIGKGNFVDAQRLIAHVAVRHQRNNQRRQQAGLAPADWPGLLSARQNLTVAEVRRALQQQGWDRAFELIQLHATHDATFDQLPVLAGNVLQQLTPVLLEKSQFRELRYYLRRAGELFPEHPAVRSGIQSLQDLASQTISRAEQALKDKESRTASIGGHNALQIWPASGELQRRYQPLQAAYPVLRVGLLDGAEILPIYLARLTDHQWFHIDSIKEGYPRYRSRFVETWTPADLGRIVELSLRLRRLPDESQPLPDGSDLIADLRAMSVDPTIDTRGFMAGQIRGIEKPTPGRVRIQFSDHPPHPLGTLATLFHQPQSLPAGHEGTQRLRHSRFRPAANAGEPIEMLPSQFRAVRAVPATSGLSRAPVAEVQHFTFKNNLDLLRALLRDQLDYLPEVPPEYVERLQSDQRFALSRYQLPRVTLLQFHPAGVLRNQPELRLALLAQLSPASLLQEIAPEGSPEAAAYLPTTSLTPRGSHAWRPSSERTQHDPIAARALLALLSRRPELPRQLRLEIPDTPQFRQLGTTIAAEWNRLGIETELVLQDFAAGNVTSSNTSRGWDARLISPWMLAPQAELPALLTVSGRVTQLELEQLSPPLRRHLLDLENATTWDAVNQSLSALQRELHLSAWMLPLWEQQIHAAVRREVQGHPNVPIVPAQEIDRWGIGPVIPGL